MTLRPVNPNTKGSNNSHSRRYAVCAAPIAFQIHEAGIITHDVALGKQAIQDLRVGPVSRRGEKPALVGA